MGILSTYADERIQDVEVNEDHLVVRLFDGRVLSVPLWWYPTLHEATPEERAKWSVCAGGYGIHWEDLDEDISAENLLRGQPAKNVSQGQVTPLRA